MNVEDLSRVAPICDTVVISVGALSWQPAHLPTGASWYMVRRLRDSLERALGGRVLTLPVLNWGSTEDLDALWTLSKTAQVEALGTLFSRLERHLSIRYIVLLMSEPGIETALQEVLRMTDRERLTVLSYVWWRDGLGAETVYRPAGEVATSLLLTFANRVVDLTKESAQEHGATRASAAWGHAVLGRLEGDLRTRVQQMWQPDDPTQA